MRIEDRQDPNMDLYLKDEGSFKGISFNSVRAKEFAKELGLENEYDFADGVYRVDIENELIDKFLSQADQRKLTYYIERW